MPVIELKTTIRAPRNICFDLARSIDLHKRSMQGTHEEAVAGITSGLIGKGEQVTWKAKHFGITQQLTSRITDLEYPHHFRDEMLEGAFKIIRHDHIFVGSGEVTIMTDKFQFKSPGGIIGQIFDRLVLERYLRKLLEKRNRIIKKVAESNQWKTILNV